MVPPQGFCFNAETAANNYFQHKPKLANVTELALSEYHHMVSQLQQAGIKVIELEQAHHLADAVFPNNWFSMHRGEDGTNTVCIYPMYAASRQAEVNLSGLEKALNKHHIAVNDVIDFRTKQTLGFEGTGSMVLDRKHKLMFVALSPRSDFSLAKTVAQKLNYQLFRFNAYDDLSRLIYHTNVMMSIGYGFVIACFEAIKEDEIKQQMRHLFNELGYEVIELNHKQLKAMCANVLQLINDKGQPILVMSETAYQSFSTEQIKNITQFSHILTVNIPTIETIGGGSARCMMAEIF